MPRAFLVKRNAGERQIKIPDADGLNMQVAVAEESSEMCIKSNKICYGPSCLERIRSDTESSDGSDACTCESRRNRYFSCASSSSTSNYSSASWEEEPNSDDGVFQNDTTKRLDESHLQAATNRSLSSEQRSAVRQYHPGLLDIMTKDGASAHVSPLIFQWMLPHQGLIPPPPNMMLPKNLLSVCSSLRDRSVDGAKLPFHVAHHDLVWRHPLDFMLGEDDDGKRHQCHVCSKSFKRASSLSNHRLIHKNLKDYKCDDCGMGFLRKSDLAKHVVIHSGSKPYQCDVCHKRFSQSSNMLTHKRRHSGVRPYSCSYCGKTFYRKVDVRRHSSVHREC